MELSMRRIRFVSIDLLLPALACGADACAEVGKLIADLGLHESAAPVRERKEWRAPKKIVVLGPADELTAAAPGAQVVVVRDVASAAAAAVDADVVVGLTSYPGICEPEILDGAKQLRWILSMSAGVERCVAVPSVLKRDLLVTNMRAIDSAAIAEHAIALALGLARGLDAFVANQARGRWSRGDAAATRMQVLSGKTLLVVG